MFVGITNEPRNYAWGSATAIAELLGHAPSGKPEAELWFGAHPGSPSRVQNPDHLDGHETLDHWIQSRPTEALGAGRTKLPFLLKLLAADGPLSLQAHPDPEQAKAGFARENAAGIALDDPTRNYKDDSAKPEIIVALSPTFEALAGFRHVSEDRMLFAELQTTAGGDDAQAIATFIDRLAQGGAAAAGSTGSSADVNADGDPGHDTVPGGAAEDGGSALKDVVGWLLRGGDDVEQLIGAVERAAARMSDRSSFAREWVTVGTLADDYPGDPGIVLSLLLNRVSLAQGQGLALAAGEIHAYLSGLGVELMASSDNVLRGGLTPKHIDVDELLSVADFAAQPVPILRPEQPAPGISIFRPDVDDFVLVQVTLGDAGYEHGYQVTGPDSASFAITGPAIAVCISGGVGIAGATDSVSLARGDSTYITPDETELTFTGSGSVFVATTP